MRFRNNKSGNTIELKTFKLVGLNMLADLVPIAHIGGTLHPLAYQ